jgi:hypothetical protein
VQLDLYRQIILSVLSVYQLANKGVSGINIYNHLPTTIKDLSGDKNKFKLALKDIPHIIPFIVWRNILVHN